ncbi:hypothetical protein BDV93DRAFT_520830 [Ceratobasidium sp. AG-I]|nr:hypothetical protein BDV93DRAFT_520830 [Ceratobasidium sp. AG-I]
MYNVLSVCAACQTSNLTHTPSHKFPSVSDYAGSSCQNFFEANETLQLLPTNEDDGIEWPNMAPPWSQSLTDETFNIQKAEDFISQTSSPNTTTTTGEVAPTEAPTPTASVSAGSSNSGSSSGPNVGAIAGGVVGGLAFLGAIIALVFFLRHRKRRSRDVAPSDEFLKPEYYATPPLLSATGDRRESEYRDDGAEDEIMPAIPHRLSWAGGLVATRRTEDEEGDMLPPFTQGTYIGPSPHEKGVPARRRTDESDGTIRTTTTNTVLLSSPTRSGPSEHV